jgi:hypothetical protein|tara:strand:- start:254 stop:466 length:213 start_codon:yes stop_codon:yes gene_type:complete
MEAPQINKIVDDLITYAFQDSFSEEERMVVASLFMTAAQMIYLQTLGDNGKKVFENDKINMLKEKQPTLH